jgi:hypothetical protein
VTTTSGGSTGGSSTTVTNTTTVYVFNPTTASYITSRSGALISAGLMQALAAGINGCNAAPGSGQQIVLVYSNGQVVDVSSITASSSFFGPIYFITTSGQALSPQSLACIQQLINSLSSQYSVSYYSAGQTVSIGAVSDGFCARWVTNSGGAQVCAGCINRYYLSAQTGRCTMARTSCNTFDNSGRCTSCYPGYTLLGGDCYIVNNVTSDANCKVFMPNGSGCRECYPGYIAPNNGICQLANSLCRSIDSNGACTSCYSGYEVRGGNCVVATQPSARNCRNFSNGICFECSNGYIKSTDGSCYPVNTLCRTWTNTGECLTCYPGYALSNGNCLLAVQAGSADPSCRRLDAQGNCLECSERFYRNVSGKCVQVNDLC